MKLKDILNNKLLYYRDTDCVYYWDYKYIVELDKENVCLINHSGSGSGYQPLEIEFVEEGFASAFFEKRYNNELDDSFVVCKDKKLSDYLQGELEDRMNLTQDFGELNVIPINTIKLQNIYDEFKNKSNGEVKE